MKITLIVAVANNNVIGHTNALPWPHIPEDMKFFRETTKGHPVVMGRRTFESIGRPLPHRTNIILTRNTDYLAEGCTIIHSTEELPNVVSDDTEVFIIGGAEIYKQFLPIANKILLTRIQADFEGDTCFPDLDTNIWKLSETKDVLSITSLNLNFQTWERK